VQALQFALLALLEEGDEVVLSDPSYATYEALVQLAGGRAVYVSLREDQDFGYDLDELRSRIGPRTRLLVLNSPQNPTGASLDLDDLEAIAEIVQEHDLAVLSDEVYSELVYGEGGAPSLLSVPGMAERCVVADSLSKTYAMCGWRVGFAVAPPEVATRLERIMMAAGLCAPSVAQVAAIEALTSPRSGGCVVDMRDEFRRRRDVMVSRLNRVPGFRCHEPGGAFYVFPSIRGTGVTDTQLAMQLLVDGGVAVLPGSSFGSRGAGHLRLSYATSLERIEEGLRRISDFMRAPTAELRASA
jgi:aspartate/methionine/tyrosine aminotransferase